MSVDGRAWGGAGGNRTVRNAKTPAEAGVFGEEIGVRS